MGLKFTNKMPGLGLNIANDNWSSTKSAWMEIGSDCVPDVISQHHSGLFVTMSDHASWSVTV